VDSVGPMTEAVTRGFQEIVTPLPRERLSLRRVMADVGAWLLITAPFVIGVGADDLAVVVTGGALLAAFAIVVGRRVPVVALVLTAAVALITPRALPALALVSHRAGRRMVNGRPAVAVFMLAPMAGSLAVVGIGVDLYTWAIRVGGLVVFGVFPWLVGQYWTQRAQLARAGWERAQQLEEQQRIIADQARLRERARIAHDMHDFLGHQLSLAALHAGALEVATDLDERHATRAGELRASIATATEQLREITSVLRDQSDPLPVAPAGEGIRSLVDRSAAAGIDVRLEMPVDLEDLDSMRQRAIYRMVQEALTNASKHAPGAPVCVRLGSDPEAMEVVVKNGPPTAEPPAPPAGRAGGQKGLVGLSERARLLGGTLSSGEVDGGFEVTMRLPHDAQRAPAPAAGDQPETEPTVAHDFDRARHRVRRSLLLAILGPATLGAALVLTLMGVYAYDTYTSVLTAEEYGRIRVGDPRSTVAEILPERQVPERGTGPEPPRNARCEYYRSTAGFLPSAFDVYRLCFRDDRLVSKDVLER
jgi:signal transduction histidine kinase